MNRDRLAALAALPLETLSREDVETIAREGLVLLLTVDSADHTPDYRYTARVDRLNRYGEDPGPGKRWLSPRELVAQAAVELEAKIPALRAAGGGE